MKRPLLSVVPASVTTRTKPVSGVVYEDILNLTEIFGLLTLLLGFEEHERGLLQAAEGASSSPGTLHETANNMQAIKQIWLRIYSFAIFSLRCWSIGGFQSTKVVADVDPELLYRVNERRKGARYEYVADCNVFMSLMEVHFPRTSLSTNAHLLFVALSMKWR